jgi:hypothetical protein
LLEKIEQVISQDWQHVVQLPTAEQRFLQGNWQDQGLALQELIIFSKGCVVPFEPLPL